MTDPAAHARLEAWTHSLLDPADPLFDAGELGVPIAIDPVRLAFAVAATGSLIVEPGATALEAGRLRVALEPRELERRLVALHRAAEVARGGADHVVWLGLGLYAWDDRRAPIVLWPVALERAGGGFRLASAPGVAPRLNDALAHRLHAERGVALAAAAPLDLAAVLDAAGALCDDARVERVARLGAFSFQRFDLWRDVLGLVLGAGASGWLAGVGAPEAMPAASPEPLIAPLDADASQLAAIAAAGTGASFVLAGAPGTGKSQTIANIVAHAITGARSVLVVSDRASALDTVHQRLAALGVADFCVPLYGARAAAAEVLDTLGRTLDRAFRPAAGPSAERRLAELRGALDGHVAALHAMTPLGMSMHDVLGRLVELRTAPCAPLAELDAPGLDRATFERRLAAARALAEAARAVEPVARHPWRGSALAAWHDHGTARATRALDGAAAAATTLGAALGELAALVPGVIARTPDQLRAVGALAELAAASPHPGAELLTIAHLDRADEVGEKVALVRARGGGVIDPPRDPAELLALAARHRALAAEVDAQFTDAIAMVDVAALWSQLKRWSTGMAPLRFVALRAVRAELRAAIQPGAPGGDDAMVAALEAVIAERACRAALEAAADPARRWYGELGGDPLALDLDKIAAAVAWGAELRRAFEQVAIAGGDHGRQLAWRALVAQVAASPAGTGEPQAATDPFARLAGAVARWDSALTELAGAVGIAELGAGADHLAALREQVIALRRQVGSLGAWTRFHLARHAAIVCGIGAAVTAIERGDLAAADLADAWQRATLLAWADAELRARPQVMRGGGAAHHACVTAFAEADRASLAAARTRMVARLAERVPRTAGTRDVDPQVAALRAARAAALAAPPGGVALRGALAALPELLPRLAPCVLATPHAIAQHLDPALPAFDLVVFDEASRLPVAHALGALARARAAVVVGDGQLPAPAGEADGLFAAALAAGLPRLQLARHYRCRHEDAIAFAARRYYGDAFELVPAPQRSAELGIALRVVDGKPDELGGNRAEADAIVGELAARLSDPARAGKSVAIVAMSRAQRDLIEDALDAARAAVPALDAALAALPEPLVIGTPDRMHGETRDVALLSIGCAADELGALAQPAAERWLAAATTRARDQLVVFASFEPEAIAGDAPAPARDLAELLAFARAGGGAARSPDASPESPIAAAIARALGERGWTVRHRVGVGRYRLDLAVVDPDDADRFVLAIELDGAVYAAASGARDRDRLRADQLTALGWRLHRIWAVDWWRDAERELHRAHGAIVAAIAASRQRRAQGSAPVRTRSARGSAPTVAPPAVASGSGPADAPPELPAYDGATTPTRIARGSIAIGPYVAASVPCGRRAPDDMFAPRYLGELGKLVEQVLAAEAPIHIDLLARRVAAYFGVGRVTPPVAEQVRAALDGRGRMGEETGIVWRLDQDPAAVPAVRVAGPSATARRDIAEVPLSELAAAARIVVERARDVTTVELVRDCARLLGFARL
ncbi:MAG TPA: DUF3320 domain-containing protein, partial [Kofleriaceae bacterium]|nr:DUF3320 domain-containing protein [Kofleriaceae bacterium]